MTTIKTSSLRTYSRVHNYLYNKHIECWRDLEQLEVSFFGLDKNQTDQLLEKITQTLSLETRHAAKPCCMSILSGKCSPKCRVHLRMSNIAPYVFASFSNYKFKSQYL